VKSIEVESRNNAKTTLASSPGVFSGSLEVELKSSPPIK
jgi:hypothetical protein